MKTNKCRVCEKEIGSGFKYAKSHRTSKLCRSCGFFDNGIVKVRRNMIDKAAYARYGQCQGITKKGKRCRAPAKSGGYCEWHDSQRKSTQIYLDYYEYIRSVEWARKSKECKHARFYICALCGGKAENAHHNSYKNLGEEMAHELTPLCANCHSLFHKHHVYDSKTGKWRLKTTP